MSVVAPTSTPSLTDASQRDRKQKKSKEKQQRKEKKEKKKAKRKEKQKRLRKEMRKMCIVLRRLAMPQYRFEWVESLHSEARDQYHALQTLCAQFATSHRASDPLHALYRFPCVGGAFQLPIVRLPYRSKRAKHGRVVANDE